jgi:hypothetical protein
MSTDYRGILSNNGERVISVFSADSDRDARDHIQQGLLGERVLYDVSDKPLAALGWKVETLVNMDTLEDVWTPPSSQTGGRKRLTKEKVVVNKKEKTVYVGPRGGRYVRANGKFVRV